MIKGFGPIHFDPVRRGIESKNRAIIAVDPELGRYYRYWFNQRYGIVPEKPPWGTHITGIKYEAIPKDRREWWGAHEGQRVNYTYEPIIRHAFRPADHVDHYLFLRAQSDDLDRIRAFLGLDKKWFHITIGKIPGQYWNDSYFRDLLDTPKGA